MLVEHTRTLHDYNLIVDVDVEYYPSGNQWHVLSDADEDSDDYDFNLIASVYDLLSNLSQYIPGVKEIDSYDSFCLTLNMDEVHKAGWADHDLIQVLQTMANAINYKEILEAVDAPYRHTIKDMYGDDRIVWRLPALLPLPGMKLLEVEYPVEIKT